MKLTGKNFQPWAEFSLDIEGLTVLVGPSNHGKSSLFRALKGVLRNDIPENFIRNKQDDPLEIELQVDGHVIKAVRKRKGSTKYTLDGNPYSSLGGKVPEELTKLGFGEVQIGEYSVDPIFATQNKSQFLIDSDRWKPQELNAILGAFSSTEKLDVGKKEANLRITQRKSEASTLAAEIRSAEERSAKLTTIALDSSIVTDALFASEKAVRTEESVAGQLASAIQHRSRLTPLEELRDSLTLPDLTAVSSLAQKADSLSTANRSLRSSRHLRELESAMDDATATWNDVVVQFKKGKGLTELFDVLDTSKNVAADYSSRLGLVLDDLSTLFSQVKPTNLSIAYLVGVALEAIHTHEKSTSQLSELNSQLEVAEAELETYRQQFAAEEAAKKAESKPIKPGICPVCGKSLEHVCQ